MALTMNQTELSFGHLPILEGEPPQAQSQPVLQLIAGDASDRKFYRLRNAGTTAICMRFPKWEGGYGGDPLSWLGMQKVLSDMDIPVPQVLQVDEQACCIWTEDFGDNFLNFNFRETELSDTNPACAETLGYYRQAIDLLLKAQYPKRKFLGHPAESRAFDSEKLMFEMDFFFKHFVNSFLGLPLNDSNNFEYSRIQKELQTLCDTLHNAERVLTHRDYHVRNVMIVDGEVRWIDFQDARMGPHTYDVVSLLRDSYVHITPETRHNLSMYYFNKLTVARAAAKLPQFSLKEYCREFILMGLQRNVKAIGSFGYLATTKGKPSYLRYVEHTLNTILNETSLRVDGLDLRKQMPNTIEFLMSLKNGALKTTLQMKFKEFHINETF